MKKSFYRFSTIAALAVPLAAAMTLSACSKQSAKKGDEQKSASKDDGEKGKAESDHIVAIDGSSTVYPITEAVAEEFQKKNKSKVTIGVSGTGGGFKKFCTGETDVTGASRPIKESEVKLCDEKKIGYIELPVAYDGIAVVVNPKNDWVDKLTTAELKKIWAPESQGKVMKWSDVREGWPEEEIHLLGPGVDSGTYDYFTKAIVGKEHASRGDFVASEDDNVLVQGVSTDKLALGFFGFAYYAENSKKLKIVPVDDGKEDNGAGAIAPSIESVANGTYQPLSRPIFIYVSKQSTEHESVKAFIDFYLGDKGKLAKEVGYIPLPEKAYSLAKSRFESRTVGSVFTGGSKVGVSVEQLLTQK